MHKVDMRVNFAGISMKNPVVVASGTYGFGREFGEFYDLSQLGGISCKGLTFTPREGNPPPRVAETPMGMLNSVGLQNPGVDDFVANELPELRRHDLCVIANISGNTPEEYAVMSGKLSEAGVDMIEVNVSCPNVKCGGLQYGVVPELASRKHVEVIAALTEKALADAGCTRQDIDAVAVTYAPGLIGAVLVGLSFAKSVAYGLGVPLIPVHHVRGHIAANYLAFPELEPPFLALAISGGNTLIVDVRGYTDMAILGATRDDAAGECFDKAARVLGLPYPGGKPMDALAQQSPGGKYTLPRVHVEGAELDMSFSGLKTAVVNLAHNAQQKGEPLDAGALARDFTQAVSDELIPRAMEAARRTGRRTIAAAGGVAANSIIRGDLERACRQAGCRLYLPPLRLCGDNGAMIGAQGYYEYLAGHTADLSLNAYATRDLDRG